MRTRKKNYDFTLIFTAAAVTAFLAVCAAESIIKTRQAIEEKRRRQADRNKQDVAPAAEEV
ncbi:MAG: hypothetical protein IIY63_05170 [Oscillospiraceae bacterium]|nr:hypothetical protein [Oscillospiraceae bacterium]